MKPIKRIALDAVDVVIQQALSRVWEWSDQFRRIPWLDGVVCQVQSIAAGFVDIEHKLGRKPRGFIVIGYEGSTADAYPSMVSADAKTMRLDFGGAALATLWVWG